MLLDRLPTWAQALIGTLLCLLVAVQMESLARASDRAFEASVAKQVAENCAHARAIGKSAPECSVRRK